MMTGAREAAPDAARGVNVMLSRMDLAQPLPPDDQGHFEDLDRIRIDMLNEMPPEPAEAMFAGVRSFGAPVLERLRFFRWVLHDLYGGQVGQWEGSTERRDERLRAVRAGQGPAEHRRAA